MKIIQGIKSLYSVSIIMIRCHTKEMFKGFLKVFIQVKLIELQVYVSNIALAHCLILFSYDLICYMFVVSVEIEGSIICIHNQLGEGNNEMRWSEAVN